jgi:hypothetical protein
MRGISGRGTLERLCLSSSACSCPEGPAEGSRVGGIRWSRVAENVPTLKRRVLATRECPLV